MGGETFNAIFSTLGNFSGLTIFAALFVWRELRSETARHKMEQDQHTEKVRHEEKRLAFDRERLDADKSLAAALAALTSAVQNRAS